MDEPLGSSERVAARAAELMGFEFEDHWTGLKVARVPEHGILTERYSDIYGETLDAIRRDDRRVVAGVDFAADPAAGDWYIVADGGVFSSEPEEITLSGVKIFEVKCGFRMCDSPLGSDPYAMDFDVINWKRSIQMQFYSNFLAGWGEDESMDFPTERLAEAGIGGARLRPWRSYV